MFAFPDLSVYSPGGAIHQYGDRYVFYWLNTELVCLFVFNRLRVKYIHKQTLQAGLQSRFRGFVGGSRTRRPAVVGIVASGHGGWFVYLN